MGRKSVFFMTLTVWAVADVLMGDSLKPLIGEAVFGATCLFIHWESNK